VSGTAFALSSTSEDHSAEATKLDEVSSEWVVKDGTIGISVTQFGSAVVGSFSEWTSAITFDRLTGAGTVETQIAINSLTLGSVTSQAMGGDFLDAPYHETGVFSAEIMRDGDAYLAIGTLTIKGQTVPIELPFTLAYENNRAFMSGTTTVDRLSFNVGQSMPDESNLGFAVEIQISLTADFQE
jgi:polyisoprenoid-binding protein YceI